MNVNKEARRDAREYARAEMFYGEGAGNRRKLIQTAVDAKVQKSPVYAREFHRELGRQDMAEHVIKARHERERKDAAKAFNANARAIATGNYQSVNTIVLLLATAGYVAHKTGYDVKIYDAGKKKWEEFKAKRRSRHLNPAPTDPNRHKVRHIKFN